MFVWPEYPRVISRRHEIPSLNLYSVCGAVFFFTVHNSVFFCSSPYLVSHHCAGTHQLAIHVASYHQSPLTVPECFHCSYIVTSDARLQNSFFPFGVLEHLLPSTRLSIHSFLGTSNFYFKATKILGSKSLQCSRDDKTWHE